MPIDPTLNPNEAIRQQLEDNAKLLQAIYANTEKTRRYILTGQILSIVKILIIVVPLVLGFIYLWPTMPSALGTYKEFMGGSASGNGISELPIQDLLDQLKQYKTSN